MTVKITICLCLLAFLALIVAGCDGDGSLDINVTLDELWPSEDGRAWTYDLRSTVSATQLDAALTSSEDLPTIHKMRALMSSFAHTETPTNYDSVMRTSFEGDITTDSGVTGQHLTEIFLEPGKDAAVTRDFSRGILPMLWQARPDLRDRLPAPDKSNGMFGPYGVTGYCWEKTDERICGYGDLSTNISWLYLQSPLRLGATFDLQLVPEIVDDIWLHGLVVRQLNWIQGDITYKRAVEVFTLIDMGLTDMVDDTGEIIGTHHPFACYVTIFAPGVGPVYTHEWRALNISTAYDPVGIPTLVDIEAVLTGTVVPED